MTALSIFFNVQILMDIALFHSRIILNYRVGLEVVFFGLKCRICQVVLLFPTPCPMNKERLNRLGCHLFMLIQKALPNGRPPPIQIV